MTFQSWNSPMMGLYGIDPAAARKQALYRGLIDAGGAMLAQGPTPYPQSFGQTAGRGLLGFNQGTQAGMDDYYRQQMFGMQAQNLQSEAAQRQADAEAAAKKQTQIDEWVAMQPPETRAFFQAFPDVAAKAMGEQMFATQEPFVPDLETFRQGTEDVTGYWDPEQNRFVQVGAGPAWAPPQPQAPDNTLVEVWDPELGTTKWVPRSMAAGMQSAPPGGGGQSEREREIARLTAQGIDQVTAERIADGVLKLTTPDQFGNVSIVDMATGERRQLTVDAPASVGAPTPAPTGPSIADDVLLGTGVFSNLGAAANATIGQLFEGTVFPETAASRQRVQQFERTVQEALVNNDKFPVYEQELVRKLVANVGDWFEDPDVARSNLTELHSYLGQKRGAIEYSLATATLTADKRGELTDQIAAIDRVIQMMGPMGGTGEGLPDGIPEGSTPIGTTQDGKPVFRTPDGRQLVVE